MSDSLYSKMEHAQYMGPALSDNYNERVERAYKDLVMLLNKVGLADEDAKIRFSNLVKNHLSLTKEIADLQSRVEAIEDISTGISNPYKLITFFNNFYDDTALFNNTEFEVPLSQRCSIDSRHGVMTLPKIFSSSSSKLGYKDSYGNFILPASFEAAASGVSGTADAATALISSSNINSSVVDEPGKVWERNIVVNSPNVNGAEVDFYARIPTDLSPNVNANAIVVHPYPMMGAELVGVYTSSQEMVNLNSSDSYWPVNANNSYQDNADSIGWIAPGSWSGDSIVSCGPKIFYFDPKKVNAVKIRLKQNNYFFEANKFIYSYGLSFFDLRYDKFLSTGKIILKLEAPTGQTISSVNSVTPNIFNVSEAELPNVFSYRIIWETATAGVYSLNPVPFSSKVWIEIEINETLGKGTPSLSGVKVEYS